MSMSKREKRAIYAASRLISRIPAPAFGASSVTVASLANYQMDIEKVLPVVRDLFQEILEGNLNEAERMLVCMDRWFEKRNTENWQRSWTSPDLNGVAK